MYYNKLQVNDAERSFILHNALAVPGRIRREINE